MKSDSLEQTMRTAVAFQKACTESVFRAMEAGMAASRNCQSPEDLPQVRGAVLQAVAKPWEEFMRSPEFLNDMRQWMDTTIALRQQTNEFLARGQQAVQAATRQDVDALERRLHQMETLQQALLERWDVAAADIKELRQNLERRPASGSHQGRPAKRAARSKLRKQRGRVPAT